MSDDPHFQEMFRRLADAMPDHPALVDGVMRRIEHTPAVRPASRKRRWIMRATIGAAACSAAGILVWLVPLFALTPTVTLAQVQAAVARQKWVHVKYDNGRENWMSMDGMREFDKDFNGCLAVFDRSKDLDLRYRPGSGCIEKLVYPEPPGQWKPRTISQIVGFSLDMPEGAATAKQKENFVYAERHADTIDGRTMARFDQYERDALGQYLLMRQLWVDPQTRLPVRVRRLLQLGERKQPDQKYSIGEYDFPERAPESIYELGAPQGLPIVTEGMKPPADVAIVIAAAGQALDRFPTRYRLLIWGKDRWDSFELVYRDGAPINKPDRANADWRGVRIRQNHYFNLEKDQSPANHLPLPATANQVLAWTQTQVPVGTYMSDGKRTFSKDGPFPAAFHHPGSNLGPTRLQVTSARFRPLFPSGRWPTEYQWPIVGHSGPFVLLKADSDPENVPSTIAIRWDGGERRGDFYLDPAHDYLCVKWVWWEKVSGTWAKEREYRLLDLKQFPQGPWYATKKNLKTYGNPERKTVGHETTTNLDLRLLEENQFPPDTFNGDKLLEESKRQGAVIETY
jgi:hypothetical protein